MIPTGPRNLTCEPHIRPGMRERPQNNAVRSPVASEISQASTELRSTGRISITRTWPSTAARPGFVNEPIKLAPADVVMPSP